MFKKDKRRWCKYNEKKDFFLCFVNNCFGRLLYECTLQNNSAENCLSLQRRNNNNG